MLMREGPSAAAAAAAAVFEEDALTLDVQEDALSLGGKRTLRRTRSGGRAQLRTRSRAEVVSAVCARRTAPPTGWQEDEPRRVVSVLWQNSEQGGPCCIQAGFARCMHRTGCTSGMAGRTYWGVIWRLMILRLHGGGTWESSSARAASFWTRALCSPLPPGPGGLLLRLSVFES